MVEEALPELPELFRQRLVEIIPPERLEGCLATFSRVKPTAFRLNPLKANPAETQAELAGLGFDLQPVAWYEEVFTIDHEQRRALTETAAFNEGRIYIQNLSSMVAPLLLAPEAGETVLDLAAAPGGKTLQLAASMGGQGHLVAVDAVRQRFYRLKANLERCGAGLVQTYMMDGRRAGRRWPEQFDRILLDAPCSSEARFNRHDPDSWRYWSRRKIKESARKQRGLLAAAYYALKPGGTLLYCTCSFSPEENEVVVHKLLRKAGGNLRIQPVGLKIPNIQSGLTRWAGKELDPDLAKSLRILPDEMMDGFFLCKMKKVKS